MTFRWVRVSSKFSAEDGGEVAGGHDQHNAAGKNPGQRAHRALRAAGSAAILVAGITASLAFAASPASDETAHAQWRENMLHKATPGKGCFQASFPAVRWESAPCRAVTGSTHPLPRLTGLTGPQTVGNGNDYALVAPGSNLITQTVGSFPSVIGVTSESSVGVASFGGGGILGSNEYTLQINTNNSSTTSACSGGASGCTVWQQFLYAPDQLVSGSAGVFIQYWLLGYGASGASCPNGYTTSKSSCYINSSAVEAPDTKITGLGNLQLTATAAAGGNDTVSVFNGTKAYSVTASDSVLKIGTVWTQSEFNVVGDAGGSEAVFNTGSVITVNVTAQYGSTTAPTCASGAGTTGETNNLNLLPCSATGGTTPSVQFIESLISAPTISKTFSPTSISAGGTSTVTLTLSNPNTGISLTGAAFSDSLSGMSAVGGAVGGTCSGTSPGTLSAGATNLSFSNITIPAGASCTVTFSVTSPDFGVFTNTASGVSSNQALTGNPSNTVSLTVVAIPQTITFTTSPPASAVYGTRFTVAATGGGSGNPVTFTSSGSCTNSGATYTMTAGTGTCSVIANQAGNMTYAAAPTSTLSVGAIKAVLTVTATSFTQPYNTPLPTLTYSFSGFVSPDTPSVVSGAPVLTTTATATSLPGVYPINIAQGTLAAANYSFNLVNGTLTLTLPVGLGQCVPFPVTLAAPAGPTGAAVTLTSSNASTVDFSPGVNPVVVIIEPGQTSPTRGEIPQVCGVNFGTTTVNAAPGVTTTSETVTVQVTATLSFAFASSTATAGTQDRLQLNLSVPAPAPGGLTVNLSSANAAVATVPATIVIPANSTSVIVPVTAVAAGSTVITASDLPNVPAATTSVTVQ